MKKENLVMLEENDKSTRGENNMESSCTLLRAVKSTAVVKYTAVQTPATFAQLQCNTDLNHPPSNWLSSSAESYGLQNVWSHNSGFSSFRMAHMFPDCVGEVDVVSDAENIKKLLKMPYSHGVVSMMVHRIENTLLLDDFDIHKYLLRQAETDWEWLKKFFYENIFENNTGDDKKKKKLFHKTSHNSRNTLQQKNLISKFLYHSLVLADNKLKDNGDEEDSKTAPTNADSVDKDDIVKVNSESALPLQSVEPMLPEPTHEDKLPDPNHNHNFTRNVVWTFENIQMLIGTDMPIFGGQTHPCISLRLRDMNKPINVLTGIDYWLDNLMSNVPEVIMCYHLDGIVKKYELIKTEDLPNLDDAQFSPKVIRDIAQNILSFLKNNATKSGHTYWLFKGKDDDVVKLYDLTSLCTDDISANDESDTDKGQNPFTVPVAMLLYRVARNMKYSLERPTRGHDGTIRTLLNNCVQLLNRQKYPQIVTSAHYMLSDLYIPAHTDPAKPVLIEDNYNDESTTDCSNDTTDIHSKENNINSNVGNGGLNLEENEETVSATASVKSLMLTDMKVQSEQEESKYKPPPIIGNIVERCQIALLHVYNGLECLIYFPSGQVCDEDEKDSFHDSRNNVESSESHTEYFNYNGDSKKYKEERQNTAKPFEAIPMPYYPLEALKKGCALENTNGERLNSSNSPRNKNKKKKIRKHGSTTNVNSDVRDDKTLREKALLLCQKSKVETLPTWEAPKKTDNHSWKAHLKTLLYEKASLIFAVMAEYEYGNQNYGASLRYIINVLKCQKILEIFCNIKNDKLISYLLGRAGDCCLMTVQDWPNINKHRAKFEINDEIDDKIVGEISRIEGDIDMNGGEYFVGALESIESCLLASHKSYEKALSFELIEMDRKNLLRRLGNIHNELGVLYMNQASNKCQQQPDQKNQNNNHNFIDNLTSLSDSGSIDIPWLLAQSSSHLESGIRAFESVKDEANLALLHSNTGRLMRLCAHINVNKQIQERQFYAKALASYQKALQVLGNKKTNPSIWDTVNWDLSTTLFTMATLLQDYPIIGDKTNQDEIEKELVEILHKALKHCDCDTPGSRQLVYQFRAATIQHRLGSFYHRSYRQLECDCDSLKRKAALQLSKLHYEKAAKLFLSLEQTVEFLTVQMELVALSEYQAQLTTLFNAKLKIYQNALDYIFQCEPILKYLQIKSQNKKNSEERGNNQFNREQVDSLVNSIVEEEQDQDKEEEKLVLLLEERLQYLLKSLTKLCLGKNNISISIDKRECQNLANLYKKCYGRSLGLENGADTLLIDRLACLIKELKVMVSQKDESL